MTRQRLRPAPSEDEMRSMYPVPHDHLRWRDHHLRVETTIRVGRWMLEGTATEAVAGADLSCGNGSILGSIQVPVKYYGDYAAGWTYTGPIEKTIHEIPHVDIFVLSETLEHLDDPDLVLRGIREKSDQLLLSTPVGCWNDDNREHLWAWSRDDVADMLRSAGWHPYIYSSVDFTPMGLPYEFGIFGAR